MRLKPQVHPLTWEVLTGVSNELRGGLMVTGLSTTVEARFKVDLRFDVTFGRQWCQSERLELSHVSPMNSFCINGLGAIAAHCWLMPTCAACRC